VLVARTWDENVKETLKTYRPKIVTETEDWRKSHNKELHNICIMAVIERVMC
jgi:hypothetical protein